MALPASKVLQIFQAGIETVVSKWKPKMFKHFSIINSWGHLGPLGVEAVEKEIKEKGLEEEVRRETGDNFFMLYGTKSKSIYELKLENHEVKIKVESPIPSDEEDEDSQDARNAEITLDAAKCSEIDLYFKNKFGEVEDPPETEREKLVRQIAKLAPKPRKGPKEEKKLKELLDKLKKLDRDEAAAAAGGTSKN